MKFIEIKGDSMIPTLSPNSIIITKDLFEKTTEYKQNMISHNKLVVFKYLDKKLIKRVIGLPGDNVTIEDDIVKIKDSIVFTYPTKKLQYYDIRIPEGFIFVVGDNPNNSLDSRTLGPIPLDSIIGVVKARIWPPKLY